MLNQRSHGAATNKGAQRPESFREGAQELEGERDTDLLYVSWRYRRVYEHRGFGERRGLLALRGALPLPDLKRGQIVIMDNLQVHKMRKVRELIEGCSCSLVFLLLYSLDFNPIEEAFSKIKTILRKAKARSFEALVEASGEALHTLTKQDALGFFAHCGYGTPPAHPR